MAERIGAAEHGVFGFGQQTAKGRALQKGPQIAQEKLGVFRKREEGDAPRVVDILVEHARQAGLFQRLDQARRIVAFAKGQQLHEQAAVEAQLPAIGGLASFADIYTFWKWIAHRRVRPHLVASGEWRVASMDSGS